MLAFQDLITKASPGDVDQIVDLVNTAYRCKSTPGWTSESDIIDGARTNSIDVMALLAPPESEIFVVKDKNRIIACVHLEKDNDKACVGMLAIDPALQGQGYGSMLLEYVETFARNHFLAKKAVMCVIAQRTELVDYYLRRGYFFEGGVCEYPRHLNIGMPMQDELTIQFLNKNL